MEGSDRVPLHGLGQLRRHREVGGVVAVAAGDVAPVDQAVDALDDEVASVHVEHLHVHAVEAAAGAGVHPLDEALPRELRAPVGVRGRQVVRHAHRRDLLLGTAEGTGEHGVDADG